VIDSFFVAASSRPDHVRDTVHTVMPSQPWYSAGLCFSCTGCGHCCRVEGHVWVDALEIDALARHLDLTLSAFGRRFLRRVGNRLSLVEKPNRDCIFWEGGCTVYPARPGQCRTFPFWPDTIADPASWQSAAGECEGIGQGRLYERTEIEALRAGRGSTVASSRPGNDPDGSPTPVTGSVAKSPTGD
jgi:Fe-S-cluster containining protein